MGRYGEWTLGSLSFGVWSALGLGYRAINLPRALAAGGFLCLESLSGMDDALPPSGDQAGKGDDKNHGGHRGE